MKTLCRLKLTALLTLLLGFPLAWFAFSQQISETDSPIDRAAYQELAAREVMNVDDLESLIREARDWYAIITPPASDFILRQPVHPVIPFSWGHFPKDLPDVLGDRYEYEYSVPVYKLRAVEDRETRQLHFYGNDNEMLFTINAPGDYDPFQMLKARYPGLYSGRYPFSEVQSYEAMYDPARVELIVTLIPTEYVEYYLYAQAKVFEYQRSLKSEDEDGGGILMLMGGSGELRITGMTLQTNGTLLELSYPEEFTNTVDVFATQYLPEGVWLLIDSGLIPDGTNAITWLRESHKNFEVITFADGATDSDGDGFPDSHEFLLYGTDFDSDASYPVTVQGEIAYTGIETGAIHVLMIPEADDNWSMARAITLQGPGPFTSAPVANFAPYVLRAFRDPDGSGRYEQWKPVGEYPFSLYLEENVANIAIHVEDVPSIWGTLDYGGSVTGDVYVVAISEHEWDTTYHTTIPWVQAQGSLTGDPVHVSFPLSYTITGIPPGDYYVRAWIDENGDGQFNHMEEGGQFALDRIPISNRVTEVDFTIALDSVDDGIPDWWKMEHFAGPFSQGSGADDDPDGDGFTNSEEYNMASSPISTVRNGPQLAEALRRATLRVDIDDSENCGGSNDESQDRTAVFQVGQLEDVGYILSVEVEGVVENHNSNYDFVTVNDVYFFSSNNNLQECSNMAFKVESQEIIAISGGEIILRYDTIDSMYHVGAYAEMMEAAHVGTIQLEFDVLDWNPLMEDSENHYVAIISAPPNHFSTSLPRLDVGDTFTLDATVRITTNPEIPVNIADDICSQWKLRIFQNVIAHNDHRIIWTTNYVTATINPLPGYDPVEDEAPFLYAGHQVSLSVADSPADSLRPLWNPLGGQPNNPLTQIIRETTFATWLVAEHQDTSKRTYLKWVEWNVAYVVTYDVSASSVGTSLTVWSFDLLGHGDGMGAHVPSFTGFTETITEHPLP